MAKRKNPQQMSLFGDWLVVEGVAEPPNKPRFLLAQRLAEKLNKDGEITSRFLTTEANRVFGGTQAEGMYSSKDAYDAMEVAFNIHLNTTERSDWNSKNTEWASNKAQELTERILKLPTQTRRDEEMDEFQQFSTPPALSFVANWVANVNSSDVMMEPSAGTGDLAIWSHIAGTGLVLNELSVRRQELLIDLFSEATLYKENAEQLDNVLPTHVIPTVIIMNPPFSSSAGRVQGQRDTANGARHIEQALKRLQDNGRLVAIAGQGMAADRPAYRRWWQEIADKYSVRANISISGKEYAKYGTTFDNQILVIDKTGPTTKPVLTGKVESVAELPIVLEGIRNERQHIQPSINKPAVNEGSQTVSGTIQPVGGIGGVEPRSSSVGTQPLGHRGDRGALVVNGKTPGKSSISDVIDDGIGAGSGIHIGAVGDTGGSSGSDIGGNNSFDKGDNVGSVTIEATSGEIREFSESVFAQYIPQRLTIPGAKQHPGSLVQSAAMSAVEPPEPTYAPVLPEKVIRDGLLSLAQLESIVYAGQAHAQRLPNGSRKGFFIGDGTGVGKGREISGIILDNMMQGRNKAVWVSFNEGLLDDARRDFAGVGGDPDTIFFQGKTKAGGHIIQKDGIVFTTYSTLRSGEKKQATDLGQKAGKSRAQQIIDWLGKDFDGVIAFDEAHSMGNAIAIKGNRGVRKPSLQAIAGINLQRELPNARVTYVSATGATEISNLSYADRLGLWGEGTPFADVTAFISNVAKGGIASMELISRDMKALGVYLSRSLSYDGVSYERLEHTLSPLQEDIYNELAGAWQVVLKNVEQALVITQAGSNGNAKSAALSQFWGAHQRFFNQIITAMQTPTVIDDIRAQLDAGNVAVIQLVNTNEAAQERIIAEATANHAALEDLDFTPRQLLIDYVRNGFPVAAYEESTDDNGNIVYLPVLDSEGNQVFDREAIAMRDALLETLHQIRVPENPLDSIINTFGFDRVAEVTGRSRRFVQVRDDEGNLKIIEEKRGKNASKTDAEAFQRSQKDILIFSGAGGTGYSFHADNTAENQRKRIHYILQPGWQADKAVQGFGRTHRTNQAQEPHYVLPTTNLKAQKRFVSSIARRLDQLGALTRGQREATSQGIFTAADNLESEYSSTALMNLFGDLYRGKTNLVFQDVTNQMGLNLLDENGSLNETKIPSVPQFLNRLLSLKTDMQNAVFNEFENRLVEAVEYSKQNGLYDMGLQTLKALHIQKLRDEVVYEEKSTGAQTRYVELAVTNTIEYEKWDDAKQRFERHKEKDDLSGWFVSEFGKNKGDVFCLRDIGERLDSEGNTVRRGAVHSIRKNEPKYIDNADEVSRGEAYRKVDDRYQRVTITRQVNEAAAEKLWQEQIAKAPKTTTKTEGMIVGVILPIWDRVEGSEVIKRLQTDEGEQLLGRMLGQKASKQTLKNLGLGSGLADLSAGDLFLSIKNGKKAILSNGWEISTSKVNYQDRIEIKARSTLTEGDKRILKAQGTFVERISWTERVFIPTGDSGIATLERIIASKPVVELIAKNQDKDVEHGFGIPDQRTPTISHADPVETNKQDDAEEKSPMKNDTAGTIANTIIEGLKNGTAPWTKPWTPEQCIAPYNPTTGADYKGVNFIYLSMLGKPDPRWLTYKQGAAHGWQVRKGEKGRTIQFFKFTDEKLNPSTGEIELVKLERPLWRNYTVFNAEQFDHIPALEKREGELSEWERHERAEKLLAASGASIQHVRGERAFYRPSSDSITLPEKGQFNTPDGYYATALHEVGHWTGHESRLARDLQHPFGSTGYAKEELRAEIASYMLGMQLGIGHDPGQHLSYIDSWVSILEEKPTEIFQACADAGKIQSYILAFEQEKEQVKEEEGIMEQSPEFIVATESFTLVTPEKDFSDLKEAARFATPVAALQEALAIREQEKDYLEGSELYIYQVDPGNHVHLKPIISTGTPQEMAALWKKNIGTELPEILATQEQTTPPGATFLSFCCAKDTSDNTFELLAGGGGRADGILRLNCAIERDIDDPRLNIEALNDEFIDGVILLRNGKPVEAVVFNDPELHKSMYAAGRGLEKNYLKVPFEEKNQAKALGATWDDRAKAWYIPDGLSKDPLTKWLPENATIVTAENPQEQFARIITEMGGNLHGEYPIMDGIIHRIPEIDGKRGNKNIAYVGHLDGVPAGWVKSFRGEERRWKMAGVVLTTEDRERLQKEGEEKRAQREREREVLQENKAKESLDYVNSLAVATGQEEYYTEKGIAPLFFGVKKDQSDNIVVPLIDIDGNHWSHVKLRKNGFKQIFKDSKAHGTFHLIGASNPGEIAGSFLLAEGYSTGAVINELTGQPVIVCTTANNLEPVAVALNERHPDKSIIVMADNDAYLESEGKNNSGLTKAIAAADAVEGHVIKPDFGKEQLDKSKTDFLDMARLQGKENTRKYLAAQLGMLEATRAAFHKETVAEKGKETEVKKPEKATERQEAVADLGR